MVATHYTDDSIAESLQEHVLIPLSTAERTAKTEYEEVEAERRAFGEFNECVAGIPSESIHHSISVPTQRACTVETHTRGVERARTAFRETVMSVDHYEEFYDETLEEHAAAELSAEIAVGLRQETTTPFTEMYKAALTTAIDNAIDQREIICQHIDIELESLDTNRTALVDILAACDGPSIPAWYRNDFEDQLDEIVRTRQQTIQQRDPVSRADGHDLCQYLYQDHAWTYPILTAVTRLRTAVTEE